MSIARLAPYLVGHRFLYIGQTHHLPGVLRQLAKGSAHATTLDDLDALVMLRTGPDVVLSPLLCESHDILDVARALKTLGYHGALIAVTRNLPRFSVVKNEVREIWTAGDFQIIETDQFLN